MPAPVVSNSSPVIALEPIGHLDLLERLFGQIVIPGGVALEVAPTLPRLPGWIETIERPAASRRPLG